jgi:hypothetical protein
MQRAEHIAHVRERTGAYRVLIRKPEGKREHLEDPSIDVRIMLKWIFKKRDGSMKYIAVAQERDRWRVLVNALMNCSVS